MGRLLLWTLVVLLALVGLRPAPAAAQQQQEEDQRPVVRQLKFDGAKTIPIEVLISSIQTTNSSWFATSGLVRWIGLGAKRYFEERDFQGDVLRLKILYRKWGFPDVAVDTLVRHTDEDVYITFKITEGRPVLVDTLSITGIDSFPETVRRLITLDLPLRSGDIFNRFLMQASADTITRRLRDHGYPSADVFTGFNSHLAERTAAVSLDVHPGVRAVIGTVSITGAQRVDTAVVVDLLAAQRGRRYSQDDLYRSQRNLYDSDLFRFASVQIDTSKFEPGSDTVPLAIQVTESPPVRLRAAAGYGTEDCFRGSGGTTLRNFLGRGRVLDINGRVSKLGVGTPTDWGLEDRWLCGPLSEDSIASTQVNYNLTSTLRRPAFLSPNNTLNLTAFTERRGEFKVYLRQETGVSVAMVRQSPRRRIPLSVTYTLASGRTDASNATFCAFLQACRPADIELLRERHPYAGLTGTASLATTNNPLDPSRGHLYSFEATVANRILGSSNLIQFERLLADAAWYQPLSRGVVLSWHLRGGLTASPKVQLADSAFTYVPPEQRFYAGGPNDVRGFNRNELGPVVYVVSEPYLNSVAGNAAALDPDSVHVTPTGGNTLVVGNVELRLPSPFFRQRLRFAAFVDVGGLWERGRSDVSASKLRLTPGVGMRVATPLGPARLDVAYNASRLSPGILYVARQNGALDTVQSSYQLPHIRRFTVHFSIGQAF